MRKSYGVFFNDLLTRCHCVSDGPAAGHLDAGVLSWRWGDPCSSLPLHAYQTALRFKCIKIGSLSVRPANLSSQIMHFIINHHVKPLQLTILCSCSCCFCQRDERAKSGCVLIKWDSSSKIKRISVLFHDLLFIFSSPVVSHVSLFADHKTFGSL